MLTARRLGFLVPLAFELFLFMIMNKDSCYFSHDADAKDDMKCVLLIDQLGLEGYGIYWVLIETLRQQTNYKYPLALIPALAKKYNTTSEKMKTVIKNYGLFGFDDKEFFFSNSLNRRMKYLENKRIKLSEAGKRGNLVRWGNGSGGDRKESKVKESKYIYNKFYDEQIKLSEDNPDYLKFVKILFGENDLKIKLENVLRLKKQVTFKEFQTIHTYKKEYGVIISHILVNMDNYKPLTKKYQSVQRTLLNWIRLDHARKS